MANDKDPRDYVFTDRGYTSVAALKKEYCSGCGACANVCGYGAIRMIRDSDGFLVPEIDGSKCVNCGKCRRACPVLSPVYDTNPNPRCYAVMAKDDTRGKSTAGGAFGVIAEKVIRDGGYVCGAQLMGDLTTRYTIVDTMDDLDKIRGTKYVQSDTGDTFTRVREYLENGEKVLFAGCPCQVAGLKGALENKQYDGLLTLDVVCHGTPSQKVFEKYIDDVYGRENVKDFSFRTKKYGYSCFNQEAHLKDGRDIPSNFLADPYEKCMHRSIALKDICGDCPFAQTPRQGDFTAGDLFSARRFGQQCADGKGTSMLLTNTAKAEHMLEEIKGDCKLCQEIDFSKVKGRNRFGRFMNIPKASRRWLYNCMDYQPFDKVVKYADEKRYDVGIIGLWYGRNYGSMATYYALHQILTRKYHLSVLMIENPIKPEDEKHIQVARDYYDVSRRRDLRDMASLNAICDSFIVGSDQLWNIWLSRPYKQMYYLDFVDEYRKRIAYGTSFGIEYKGTEEEKLISGAELRKFDHVSVRDDYSKQACAELFGVNDAVKVLDPTLICPVEEYRKLEERSTMKDENNYILAYILDTNEEIGRYLEQLSIAKKKKILLLLDEPPWLWDEKYARLKLSGCANIVIKGHIGLYEWLWYFSHAQSVVTDSFHGTIFSIINKKPFLTLSNARRGAQRFVSLLKPLELENRLFQEPEDICRHANCLKELDYTRADELLGQMQKESFAWLENALFSPKKVHGYTVYDIQDVRTDK